MGHCKHLRFVGLTVVVLFILSATSTAAIIYVDDSAVGTNNGTSWNNAFTGLQSALTAAVAGDEVRVGQGTYRPAPPNGNRSSTFRLKNGVAVRGGFAGVGAANPNQRDVQAFASILSGDLNANDGPNFANNAENSYHVVTGSATGPTAVLDGFTITAGNASAVFSTDPNSSGAGMYQSGGSPTVVNCRIHRNRAMSLGGGVYNVANSDPRFTGCTFSENAAGVGLGMMNDDFSDPTVVDCVFRANSSNMIPSLGGAVYNFDHSNPTFTGCTFEDQHVNVGGALLNDTVCHATLTNCVFRGNSAGGNGGAVHLLNQSAVTATNCVFTGNLAGGDGGAVSTLTQGVTLKNCTLAQNSAAGSGGGVYALGQGPACSIVNSVVWGNTDSGTDRPAAQVTHDGGPAVDVTYSNVQGCWSGTGNICGNPRFVHPTGPDQLAGTADDDLRLKATSVCIDVGNSDAVPPEIGTDVAGNPRRIDDPGTDDSGNGGQPLVDMGAFEFQADSAHNAADLDLDGDVDLLDFALFQAFFTGP